MTARYDVYGTTVRFEYKTADGDPEKHIKLDGANWQRQGYHPLSYDATTGLVWYKKLTTNK